MINVLNDLECTCFTIGIVQIFIDPCHEVVFEDAFNELVQEIGWQRFMNIYMQKPMGKRLLGKVRMKM